MEVLGAALVAATALHAGFQLTVTLVVYPALVRVPADGWAAAHAAHTRRILPLVALTYGALGAALIATAVVGPVDLAWGVAAAGSALAVGTTLLVAGPVHARLVAPPDPTLVRRLVVSDRVRTLAGLVALGGAVGWAG